MERKHSSETTPSPAPAAASVCIWSNLAGGIVVQRKSGNTEHHVRVRYDGSVEWTEFEDNKIVSMVEWKGQGSLASLLAERDEDHAVDEQPPSPAAAEGLAAELRQKIEEQRELPFSDIAGGWIRTNWKAVADALEAGERQRDGTEAALAIMSRAIRKVVTQRADAICWRDVYTELAGLVGVQFTPELICDHEKFIANCRAFDASMRHGGEYKPVFVERADAAEQRVRELEGERDAARTESSALYRRLLLATNESPEAIDASGLSTVKPVPESAP